MTIILKRALSESSSSSPSPPPRHSSAASTAKGVSFCALQLEIADSAENGLKHVEYNRGKSIEDLFEPGLASFPPTSYKDGIAAARRARGRRLMGELTVTTFDIMDKLDEAASGPRYPSSKESTPASDHYAERGGMSKPSTKESTPASVGAASTASTSSSSNADKDSVINFISGNPFVEVSKGVLHLYKENQTTSLEEGVIRSQMLCMIGVPAKIKSPDLLQFTAPCHSELEMMRVIQDSSPNQYMTLLRFRCQEAADEFYQAFNGQRFNTLESDVCSLVYVSKVETCKESEYFPMAGHTELPLCSICLERMDESISTVLTILCNHSFHGSCLAQWEDSTCPVCRHVQTPEVVAEQRCSDCQSSEDLWICLVCGYVGCGRYVGGHSHAHFAQTQHCYTMELGANRVWDYVGDNFVHRLVQTECADGKIVEAGNGSGGRASDDCKADGAKNIDGITVNSDEQLDSIQLEYTYLLTSQLEAQRRYFEEKIKRLEEDSHQEMEEVMSRALASMEESKTMEEKMASLSKEKAKAETKLGQMTAKMGKVTEALKEEQHLNESLRKNQSQLQDQLATLKKADAEKDKTIEELQDQMRDLMVFIGAQSKIANSPLADEIKDGAACVGEDSPRGAQGRTPTGSGLRGTKKRRGK